MSIKSIVLAVGAVVFAIQWLSGCSGGSDRPVTVAVEGEVTWNQDALKSGTITFYPKDGKTGRTATGTIDARGQFQMMTYSPGDGVIPGEYQVSVRAYAEPVDPNAKTEGTRILPDKFYDAAKSGLNASIKADEETQIVNFALEGNR